MAIEKTYTEIIDEAHYREQMGFEIKIRSPKKYRKLHGKPEEKFVDKELKSGTRIIAGAKRGSPRYYLCTVLDFENSDDYWNERISLIAQVNECSQPDDDQVGRIKVVDALRYGGGTLMLMEVGKANWHKYIPSGAV